MEELMTGILVHPQLSAFQEMELALPFLIRAYFVSEIRRSNLFVAFMETLLFAVYHFLKARNFISTVILLTYESSVLLIAYLFAKLQLFALILIAPILCVWKLHYFEQRYIHPRKITSKCFIFFIFKYVLGAPEEVLCLICIVTVTHEYIYNFNLKSIHDSFLMIVMLQLSAILVYSSAESMYSETFKEKDNIERFKVTKRFGCAHNRRNIMERITVYELFIRPFEGSENFIEFVVSSIISAMIKALFISSVMCKENFHNACIKTILFSIYRLQRTRDFLLGSALILVDCTFIYILISLKRFAVAYLVITSLELYLGRFYIMDNMLLECFIWFIFRKVLCFPDFLIVLICVMCIGACYIMGDQNKYKGDILLGLVLFRILWHFVFCSVVSIDTIFDIFLLSFIWMMLKYDYLHRIN